MKRITISLMVCVSLGHTLTAQVKWINPIKLVQSKHAAVVSAHPIATRIGIDILRAGGNAFDAGIAVQLALAVVYPNAGNLGGGGFMVAKCADGKTWCIDFREVAPGKASRDMFLDAQGQALTELSQSGHLAAGVPGTVAGIFLMMKKARLPFSTLIDPAIDLARNGFELSKRQVSELNALESEFAQNNTGVIAFVKKEKWKEGDLLIQPELARTLERIRDQGADDFYHGETARMIADEMKKSGGILSLSDLNTYQATERKAQEFDYHGHHIITMPLPSSGGVLLYQMLNMCDWKGLAKMKYPSAESIQLMIEAARRAYADRASCMGDPSFYPVPMDTLLSIEYLRKRIEDYTPLKAGDSKKTVSGIFDEHEETTHISILDEDGNAVSITTTLNDSYGSKTVVSGAGFLLNNEMDDFSIKPGVPNLYGAIGSKANEIAPGKKMLSSMTPIIVTRSGKVKYVVGSPGGTTIPTNMFITLTSLIDFHQTPEETVRQPKFHFQWLPDTVFTEKDFSKRISDSLQKMGYKLLVRGAIGRTELIATESKKKISSVADFRGDDSAGGY